jgi:hypothetical protein
MLLEHLRAQGLTMFLKTSMYMLLKKRLNTVDNWSMVSLVFPAMLRCKAARMLTQ